MTRQEYIESRYEQHLSRWTSIGLGFGGVVSLLLIPLDIIVSPENAVRFSIYRFSLLALFILLLVINRRKVDLRYNSIVAVIAGMAAATMVAALIYSFNGHESVYFVGFIILVIFLIGIVPLRFGLSMLVALMLYLFYLVPVLVYDDITNSSFFLSANILTLACITSLLIMRYFSQQALMNEFGLSYDVDQQRAKLEEYSRNLEVLVDERTRDLHASEKMLRSLFQGASVGIIITEKDMTITGANELACSMLGYQRSELAGSLITKIEPAHTDVGLQEQYDRIIAGETLRSEMVLLTRDGSELPVEIAASAVDTGGDTRVQFFIQDATEKKRLIAQLTQSQKMEAVGRLAGGVAHDFNNLLMTITGNCDLALLDLEPDHEVRKQIDEIKESARRAAAVTSQLLSFSRKQVMRMEQVDLNEIVVGMGKMLARLIGEEIDLRVETDDQLRPIRADTSRLEQILMNLAVNARDAMPYGGTLTISTDDVEADADYVAAFDGLTPGSYAVLTVADSGEGIDAEVIANIFEPFFTTKEMGKGTGLGLATVLGIVKQHHGYVYVESHPGSGTSITIFLPVDTGWRNESASVYEARAEEQEDLNLDSAGPELRGNETILVVDDEATVRGVVVAALSHLGYNSLEANSAERALELCRDHDGEIDLLLTDLIMPGMNGRELVEAVKSEYPGMMSLYMSGYTDDIIEKHGLPDSGQEFIQKPVAPMELARKLRSVLNN